MALTTTSRKIIRTGDGTTVTYPVPFPFLDNSHLKVYLVDLLTGTATLQTITTHYTISGTGSLLSASVVFVTAPTSASKVVIYRDTPITQLYELFDNETQTATTIEEALDKLTMICQELGEETGRSVVQEIFETDPLPTPGTDDTVTDIFLGKITGSPTDGNHPFREEEPVTGSITNQELSGGRTGNLRFVNGCTDDKSNQYVFVIQMRDSGGTTVYRAQIPGS